MDPLQASVTSSQIATGPPDIHQGWDFKSVSPTLLIPMKVYIVMTKAPVKHVPVG